MLEKSWKLDSPAVGRPAVALEPEVRVAEAAGGLASTAGHVDHLGKLVLGAERCPLVPLCTCRDPQLYRSAWYRR